MRSGSEEARRLDTLGFKEALAVGVAQIGALSRALADRASRWSPGSYAGSTTNAARFSFLLATPIIFAAGIYKLPDLTGPLGDGVRAQAIVGSIFAGLAAYVSVKFLMRFFEGGNLMPFAIYCVVFGGLSIIRFA